MTLGGPQYLSSLLVFDTVTADTVADENYEIGFAWWLAGLANNTASVILTGTVSDDDAASADVTLSPTSTLTSIAEGGSTIFTAVLDAQSSRDVVVTLTSSDTDIATVEPAMLPFTTDTVSWQTLQL